MSWRIVSVSSISKLDYKMDYMEVRNAEGTQRVHLSEISILIVESTAVSLTAYLLCELIRHKIDIIFCDEKRLPYGMLLPLYGCHDTSRSYRKQVEWTEETKGIIWQEIVKSKIRGQAFVLPDERDSERNLMLSYIPQVMPGDVTNREGHAAKVYFNALFGMGFSRDDECAINAALNYGYGIMLSAFAREIVACGYCTQIGLHHVNVFNDFNLASDLMEPFRPFVDLVVRDMDHSEFGKEQKLQLVRMLNEQIKIGGQYQFMINAIRVYVRSVFDAIDEQDPSYLRFPVYEL